ncbi:hypothetical protein [Kingella sp. (in: b-proteobacteria)]|uniref:hypothetical protein n=1 Tax=Kingella sp. (in: b-proteobacteria) TaxID=2020713 RepID=UPI0026DD50FF|nr:hypothetical protein [Kingella sp. (in: b-proteobacteria)]MDO4656698.1 hypothetical protein [Kingella sp. (in: b-proteobacteria)]
MRCLSMVVAFLWIVVVAARDGFQAAIVNIYCGLGSLKTSEARFSETKTGI